MSAVNNAFQQRGTAVPPQSDRDPASGSLSHIPHPTSTFVGLMSGTSLDGISAAVVRFSEDDSAELLAFRQLP